MRGPSPIRRRARSCSCPTTPRSAMVKACLYDPQVNRTYAEMAAHYGTAVLPARPRNPSDKAKVEAGVLIVERWLLGAFAPPALLQPWPRSTQPSPRCWSSINERRVPCATSGAPAASCSRSSTPRAEALAGRALRPGRVAAAEGRPRLSRRRRRPLLLRALSPRPRQSRGAAHGCAPSRFS